jgi:MFS family permease
MATCSTGPIPLPAQSNLFPLYATEAVNSLASTLLTVGLPFYTSHRFGWGARENFAIAALQGVLYVLGALSAQKLSRRWGAERSLPALYAGMTAFAVAVGICASKAWPLAAVLLVIIETGLMAASWPMLESLISAAGDPGRLSQRLGFYNVIWASVGAIAVAGSGAIIQHTPGWGFFGIVAAGHFLAGVLIPRGARSVAAVFDEGASDRSDPIHLNPEQQAIDKVTAGRHRLALYLSRIALPSTYVIVYSLAPALPSLSVIQQLSPTVATLVASIWLVARALAFVITGRTTFWHKRPGLMLIASITMLAAFVGTMAAGALSDVSLTGALLAMAFAQSILGLSIGTIYSASLYFGMAVSDGSTEHGGYHEALIGLGQILGPLVGAGMQWIYPAALRPAVIGISGVVSLSVIIQAIVGARVAGKACTPFAGSASLSKFRRSGRR